MYIILSNFFFLITQLKHLVVHSSVDRSTFEFLQPMEGTSPSHQLYADEFVESAGAVVFDFFKVYQICIVYNSVKNEYLLPKGRRNCTESRANAALREVREETGYTCLLSPVTMGTRAPPADELDFNHDGAASTGKCMRAVRVDDSG